MFELLFKYPWAVFAHGSLGLRSALPAWLLGVTIVVAGGVLWLALRLRGRNRGETLGGWRLPMIWGLQAAAVALLLVLLWRPALAVSTLVPQANIVAVLVDDSRSMAAREDGASREERALAVLPGLLRDLGRTFQVRLYRLDTGVTRVTDAGDIRPTAPATHVGDALAALAAETASLPLGAVVLLGDGGDNAGFIPRSVIDSLRQRQVPVHTVGIGSEQVDHDVELEDVALEPRALAGSRIGAVVSLSQRGFAGRRVTVTARAGSKLLASREVVLPGDGAVLPVELALDVGAAGPETVDFSAAPLAGETNRANNAITRLLQVDPGPRRILYFEGEPRWEYKFIRRAEDGDPGLQLVSMLRTTENKIYRQGVSGPQELADGFPHTAEELFGYDALVIGSVDAGYFPPAQQQLIQGFVDRRGGGLLLLGGRQALADGVWNGSQLNELLPVVLPSANGTFRRERATASLTAAGEDSMVTRLAEDRVANGQLWTRLPQLMDYQDAGSPKPGATVLAQLHAGGRTLPLLVTQSFGRGRTAVLATGGTWRWQMSLPLGDPTHRIFWQQLLRWLVAGTHGPVSAEVSATTLLDSGLVRLTAQVRGEDWLPAAGADVQAHVIGPGSLAADVPLRAVPGDPGRYQADWSAPATGVYVAEITARLGARQAGRDTVSFQRLDGVAEAFHTGQNAALLRQLAADTGGSYWRPDQVSGLARAIPFSSAGVSVQQLDDLWNMPVNFLLLLLLRATEWLLRRRWGVV